MARRVGPVPNSVFPHGHLSDYAIRVCQQVKLALSTYVPAADLLCVRLVSAERCCRGSRHVDAFRT